MLKQLVCTLFVLFPLTTMAALPDGVTDALKAVTVDIGLLFAALGAVAVAFFAGRFVYTAIRGGR